MPPRFSLNTDLTLGVNAPLVATTIWIGQKVVHFGLRYLMPRSRVEGYCQCPLSLPLYYNFWEFSKLQRKQLYKQEGAPEWILMTIRVFSSSNIFEASNGYPWKWTSVLLKHFNNRGYWARPLGNHFTFSWVYSIVMLEVACIHLGL
jgi:hypothetical protein